MSSSTKWKRQTTASTRAEQLRNHACDEIDCPGAHRLHIQPPPPPLVPPHQQSSSSSTGDSMTSSDHVLSENVVCGSLSGGGASVSGYCRQCDVLQKIQTAAVHATARTAQGTATASALSSSMLNELHRTFAASAAGQPIQGPSNPISSGTKSSSSAAAAVLQEAATAAAEQILSTLQYFGNGGGSGSRLNIPFRTCCRL